MFGSLWTSLDTVLGQKLIARLFSFSLYFLTGNIEKIMFLSVYLSGFDNILSKDG